jgi:hypothetical protein
MSAAAIAAFLALSLGGCVPAEPTPTPSHTTVASPLFASDDEALKAATDAYAAYLKVTDEVLHDGGHRSDLFVSVTIGDALVQALADAKEFREKSAHTTGRTKFDSERLSYYRESAFSPVEIFVCDDVGAVDVRDMNGKSLVSTDRKTRTPWQVDLRPIEQAGHLVVSERTAWIGDDFCAS